MTLFQALWIVAAIALALSCVPMVRAPSRAIRASREFRARQAARKADRRNLADMVGNHLARMSHTPEDRRLSDVDAHASLAMQAAMRDAARARLASSRGHRLYKATSAALVEESASESRTVH